MPPSWCRALRVGSNSLDETEVATTHSGIGFIDIVARVVGWRQARGVTDRTVDIGDGVAAMADNVVVVTDAEFRQGWPDCRLDATHQPTSV